MMGKTTDTKVLYNLWTQLFAFSHKLPFLATQTPGFFFFFSFFAKPNPILVKVITTITKLLIKLNISDVVLQAAVTIEQKETNAVSLCFSLFWGQLASFNDFQRRVWTLSLYQFISLNTIQNIILTNWMTEKTLFNNFVII